MLNPEIFTWLKIHWGIIFMVTGLMLGVIILWAATNWMAALGLVAFLMFLFGMVKMTI